MEKWKLKFGALNEKTWASPTGTPSKPEAFSKRILSPSVKNTPGRSKRSRRCMQTVFKDITNVNDEEDEEEPLAIQTDPGHDAEVCSYGIPSARSYLLHILISHMKFSTLKRRRFGHQKRLVPIKVTSVYGAFLVFKFC